MQNLEQAIREHAYHLWVADGRRDGAADAYWLSAQRELLNASVAASDVGTLPVMSEPDVAKKKAPVKPKAGKSAAPAKTKRRVA